MKVILVASGKGGTGKTSLTAGVGAALWALADMRLIEADERGARLLPMEKRDPMDSAAVQTLLRLRAEGR